MPFWTNVVFAMAPVPFTSADARAFQWASVIAMAMFWTTAVCAAVTEPAAFVQLIQWVATPPLLAMRFALSKEENSKCSTERAMRPMDHGS